MKNTAKIFTNGRSQAVRLNKAMDRQIQLDTELHKSREERPPIFRTWRRLYFAVLGNLVLLIAIFYLITCIFS